MKSSESLQALNTEWRFSDFEQSTTSDWMFNKAEKGIYFLMKLVIPGIDQSLHVPVQAWNETLSEPASEIEPRDKSKTYLGAYGGQDENAKLWEPEF